jgi:DNA-binding IclR family transcriptional regulator
VEAQRHLSVTSPVGTRSPVVLGASGACLLIALDEAAVSQQIAYADRESLWEHESADMLRSRMKACRKKGVCDNIGVHPQGIDTLSAPLVSASRPLALTMVGLRGDFDGARLSQYRKLLLATVNKARPKLEALV